jgi:hypothetical protein
MTSPWEALLRDLRDGPDFEPWDEPTRPARKKRKRKRSLAQIFKQAKKAGGEVTIAPDGAVTFKCSTSEQAASAPINDINEWDEVLSHGKH